MKVDKIIADYEYVMNDCQHENEAIRYDIKTYFENNSNSYSSLANNHGALAAKEFVTYLTGLLFPMDGSWLGVELEDNTKEQQERAHKVWKKLTKRLEDSKFYREASKFINQGVLYNRSMMEVTYESCLQFQCVKDGDIYVSKESNDGNRRAYSVAWKTAGELIEEFEGGLIEDLRERVSDMDESEFNTHYKVITCVVPVSKYFGTMNPKGGRYKYLKVYLLESDFGVDVITNPNEEGTGYYSFPFSQFLGYSENSLAAISLPIAVRLNSYEQLIGSAARKFVNPPTAIGLSTYKNYNNLDFREGSLVPVFPGEVAPAPIATTGAINVTESDILRLENKIDRNFMIELINRAKITGLSQYEAALNEIGAIMAVVPGCYDIISTSTEIVSRAHDLLMKKDKEYKKDARGLKGKFAFAGLTAKIQKLKKAVGVAKTIQAIAPLMEMDESVRDVINGERAVVNVVDCYGVPFMINSEDEVRTAREAQAEQVDEKEQQEAAMNQADVEQKQATAQAALSQ